MDALPHCPDRFGTLAADAACARDDERLLRLVLFLVIAIAAAAFAAGFIVGSPAERPALALRCSIQQSGGP